MRLVDIKMYFHPVILSHKSVVKNYYYVDSKIPSPSNIFIPTLFSLSLTRAFILTQSGDLRLCWCSKVADTTKSKSQSRCGCIRPPIGHLWYQGKVRRVPAFGIAGTEFQRKTEVSSDRSVDIREGSKIGFNSLEWRKAWLEFWTLLSYNLDGLENDEP